MARASDSSPSTASSKAELSFFPSFSQFLEKWREKKKRKSLAQKTKALVLRFSFHFLLRSGEILNEHARGLGQGLTQTVLKPFGD